MSFKNMYFCRYAAIHCICGIYETLIEVSNLVPLKAATTKSVLKCDGLIIYIH